MRAKGLSFAGIFNFALKKKKKRDIMDLNLQGTPLTIKEELL